MAVVLDICRTGLTAVLLHRLRSLTCVVALTAVLLPWLVGFALARGIEAEAEESARAGPDIRIAGSRFGRPAPLPLESVALAKKISGVVDIVPRIVGDVFLGKEKVPAVLIGLPPDALREWASSIEGELPSDAGSHELVVGPVLARRLALRIGSPLPPFYRNDRLGERTSRVTGTFRPDAPLWQAYLILTTFDSAAAIFEQEGLATDLLVSCRPGYEDAVSRAVRQRLSFPSPDGLTVVRPRTTSREEMLALMPRGVRHLQGVFNLHFVLAFVVAILVLLVTSGLGLSERRREIGILKAVGWQTDEILLRGLTESLVLSLIGVGITLLAAWVWLFLLDARGIAGIFLEGLGDSPGIRLPFRLAPVPILLAFVLSFAIVMTGTLYSSWRAAVTPPREAMR